MRPTGLFLLGEHLDAAGNDQVDGLGGVALAQNDLIAGEASVPDPRKKGGSFAVVQAREQRCLARGDAFVCGIPFFQSIHHEGRGMQAGCHAARQ